ncbi:MAG: 4-(cytidine 5'-diphospho)-2-C-methyl-D-erythritol kinase [Thermodesulfobacteriota bacterium]|nr:4-(cytidine 5'-diphospho)-2-C-methyl-D-erythritol kinase [Thermodesulfobacteriota bacterium]
MTYQTPDTNVLIEKTPAKLNIRLKVKGRRPSGYHELSSIMVPISLFDEIEFSWRRAGITLVCDGLSLPSHHNLAYRAAKAFFSHTGIDPAISIKLTKTIPVAAGLGGGSSDAACTLNVLNTHYSNPISPKELAEIALHLGADVPFFLASRPSVAQGIGEKLKPIENWPEFWYVVITPPIEVSTSWVYGNLKLELTTPDSDLIIDGLKSTPSQVRFLLENDLERVTASRFPVIDTIKKCLIEAGALGALMSGSGPSVFGVFESKDQALSAENYLSNRDFGDIFVATNWG